MAAQDLIDPVFIIEPLPMPQQLDRRTRVDADRRHIDPAEFFAGMFDDLVQRHGVIVAQGADALGARPLTLDVEGVLWTIIAGNGSVRVSAGSNADGSRVSLTRDQFSDVVQNQISFNGLLTSRQLRAEGEDDRRQLSIWDSLLLGLLEGWPTVGDGLDFVDRHGRPLDLKQSFGPDSDPADIAHFVREAGFAHLAGWLDPADMAAISADIDRALPDYVEGDGKSWWATKADGERVCVRLQEFVERSPTTSAILSGPMWERMIAALEGSDVLARQPARGRIIEALIKPVGIVSGPSDLSFHRDCHLGRHAYACARMTVGIAITPANEANGVLRVVAGSHRLAMPVEVAKADPYLPIVALPTKAGDLTVHLSCTLHEATAPVSAERRVMYTELPQSQPDGYAIDTSVQAVRGDINALTREEPVQQRA